MVQAPDLFIYKIVIQIKYKYLEVHWNKTMKMFFLKP